MQKIHRVDGANGFQPVALTFIIVSGHLSAYPLGIRPACRPVSARHPLMSARGPLMSTLCRHFGSQQSTLKARLFNIIHGTSRILSPNVSPGVEQTDVNLVLTLWKRDKTLGQGVVNILEG